MGDKGGVHGKGGVWEGVCGRGHVWQGGMCGVGVHGRGGMRAGEMATEAGGTHPTGIHSCLVLNSILSSLASNYW